MAAFAAASVRLSARAEGATVATASPTSRETSATRTSLTYTGRAPVGLLCWQGGFFPLPCIPRHPAGRPRFTIAGAHDRCRHRRTPPSAPDPRPRADRIRRARRLLGDLVLRGQVMAREPRHAGLLRVRERVPRRRWMARRHLRGRRVDAVEAQAVGAPLAARRGK